MVGGTDIGLEKRRKRNPISIDAAESRYWRSCGLQAVCGSQPDLQRIGEYCSECRTVFCGSFETESVQKEMNVLSVVVFSGGPDRNRLRQIP